MKHIDITSILLICALAFSSCEKLTPDLPMPEGATVRVTTEEDPTILYTEAKVQATVRLYGAYEVTPEEYRDNLEFLYGSERTALNRKAAARYDDGSKTFIASLTGLEDGAEYYYKAKITIRNMNYQGEVLSFVTYPKGPVSLDLPSGTRWSSHNLGADYPEDPGYYIAWGETDIRRNNGLYNWSAYTLCQGSYNKLTKYCTSADYGYEGRADNKTTLDEADDAAVAALGGTWHTPTVEEWTELMENCQWKFNVRRNGTRGAEVRSKKSPDDPKKVIFLPYAGYKSEANVSSQGYYGYYWTTSLNTRSASSTKTAYNVRLSNSSMFDYGDRCYGESIRPVCK